MDEPDPDDLFARARRGDQSAWDTIVYRYQGLIWATVRAFRLDDQEAADVVQTTWLRLVENLHSLRDPSRLGAWLSRCGGILSQPSSTALLHAASLPFLGSSANC